MYHVPVALLRPTIKDARGRRFPLIRHEVLIPGISDPARVQRLQSAARTDLKLTGADKRRLILWYFATFPIIVAAGAVGPMMLNIGNWWSLLWFLPMVVLPAAITSFVFRRAVAHRFADMYTRAGLCASCGYELRDVPADANKLTTCPECGAVWQVP